MRVVLRPLVALQEFTCEGHVLLSKLNTELGLWANT